MWHLKSKKQILSIFQKNNSKVRLHPVLSSLIFVIVFYAFLYAISAIDRYFGWHTAREKMGQGSNMLDVPILTVLWAAPIGTILAYYFFFRYTTSKVPTPVACICFDCQAPFSGFDRCPKCDGTNISDIRFAEWRDDKSSSQKDAGRNSCGGE